MNAVLNKNDAVEKLWERKTAEMNEYLKNINPGLGGYPDFFPQSIPGKNVAEKIFNADFELDWIPKGLRLLDLKKDPNLFYQYQIINAPDSSSRGDLATIPRPSTEFSKRERGGEIRHVRYYWWGGQKFAQEQVGGYWVLWFPDIYCLNQPANIQKGPCEVFAKQIFELSEKAGRFPHITELVYLLLLHKHRVPDYAKEANFIENFVRSGTLSPAGGEQSNLLLAAGWKLSKASENAPGELALNIDDFPFHAAFKNVGAVPFVSLK